MQLSSVDFAAGVFLRSKTSLCCDGGLTSKTCIMITQTANLLENKALAYD